MFGLYIQPVAARHICYLRHRLISLLPDFGVKLHNLLAVRSQQPNYHIYAALLDDHLQDLTGAKCNLVGMALSVGQFAFDRLAQFESAHIQLVLCRAARIRSLLSRLRGHTWRGLDAPARERSSN